MRKGDGMDNKTREPEEPMEDNRNGGKRDVCLIFTMRSRKGMISSVAEACYKRIP
jgi:hypothetical protein